jgi:7 transmembrane receptor (rhodopsin family)
MSLVAIAMDRFLAVLNKSKSRILQSKVFCFSGVFVVWATSCSISSPMLFGYEVYDIVVVPDDNQGAFYKAKMCMTDTVSLWEIKV